jgi:hypothetical protein
VRTTLLCGVYYMFMCLEDLARRVGGDTVYPQRTRCIAAYLEGHPFVGREMAAHTEQQFAGRAKFYFDMSDKFGQTSSS